MDIYNGTRDPHEHLETFRVHMTLHDFPREVACRAFPLILNRSERVWFKSLTPGCIDNFGELACLFLTQLMASKRRRRPMTYLLTIKQGEDECL